MANPWLVQRRLIDSAQRRGWLVLSDDPNEGFSTEDFLDLIDEVTRSIIVPLLKRTRESYLVATEDLVLTAGVAGYSLPARAAAESLRSILYDAGDGRFVPLNRVEPEEAHAYNLSDGTPAVFYLQSDTVFFVPTPGTQTVRFVYFKRPNRVVQASAVGLVSALNRGAKQVTVLSYTEDTGEFDSAAAPATFTTAALFDFVKGTPGFSCHATDLVCSGVASNVLTFSAELPDGLSVGDFVALAGETPIAQIPVELQPLLAQEVNRTMLEGKGDSKADRAGKTAERLEKNALDMLVPRTSETPKYVLNKNAPGWGRFRRRWGWWP